MTSEDMPRSVRDLLSGRLVELENHRDRLVSSIDYAEAEVAKHHRELAELRFRIEDIKAALG